MSIYLSSFYPLCCTKKGNRAIDLYKLPKYIDGSCRREPDFQHSLPAITGLCRPNFITRLKKEDIIVYVTNKRGVGARKLIAILQVIEVPMPNHRITANWYLSHGNNIPNNIIVKETKPFPLDQTHQKGEWSSCPTINNNLNDWNQQYIDRSKESPSVVICKIIYKNLQNPNDVLNEEILKIGTQNPGTLTENQYQYILSLTKE